MNSQLAYVKWVKGKFPEVYQAAVRRVQQRVSLGGLGDDLLSDISFDPDTVSASDDINYSGSGGSYNPSAAPSSSVDWSGIIHSVAAAIPTVAQSVVRTREQLQLIQTNAQLAQRGLPLQSGLIHPSGIQQNSMLILGVLALGAFALVAGGRGSSKGV